MSMYTSELINKLQKLPELPIKIYLNGIIYDFSIDILHNNRIDFDMILFSEEYVDNKVGGGG